MTFKNNTEQLLTSNPKLGVAPNTCEGETLLRCLDASHSARATIAQNKNNNRAGTSPMTSTDGNAHPVAPWPLIAAWAALAASLVWLLFIAMGGLHLG